MTARRKKGSQPIALRWHGALLDWIEHEQPSGGTRLVALAGVLLKHANADGTSITVGQRALARATVQRLQAVNDQMRWLVDEGWLTVEGRLSHGGHRRRMSFPVWSSAFRPEGNADEDSAFRPEGNADDPQRSGQRSGQRSAQSGTNLRPPGEEEEAERRPAGAPDPTPVEAELNEHAEAVLNDLSLMLKETLDPDVLTPAVAEAMAAHGWGEEETTCFAVELYERRRGTGKPIGSPSHWLAKALRSAGAIIPSPRMRYAGLRGRYTDLLDLADDGGAKEFVDARLGPAVGARKGEWFWPPGWEEVDPDEADRLSDVISSALLEWKASQQ